MINGVTKLIMTKADVLTGLKTFKVAVAYKIKGVETDEVPYEFNEHLEPIYMEMDGWEQDLSNITKYKDLPVQLKNYIKFIEAETGVPVWIVSVGPDRNATIKRDII